MNRVKLYFKIKCLYFAAVSRKHLLLSILRINTYSLNQKVQHCAKLAITI